MKSECRFCFGGVHAFVDLSNFNFIASQFAHEHWLFVGSVLCVVIFFFCRWFQLLSARIGNELDLSIDRHKMIPVFVADRREDVVEDVQPEWLTE
jgi:hypothetical protein